MPKERMLDIDGILYHIVSFLDIDGDKTDDHKKACTILLQRPEDIRPEGVQQKYLAYKIPEGSLEKQPLG